jgi:hypothetical protein
MHAIYPSLSKQLLEIRFYLLMFLVSTTPVDCSYCFKKNMC